MSLQICEVFSLTTVVILVTTEQQYSAQLKVLWLSGMMPRELGWCVVWARLRVPVAAHMQPEAESTGCA